MREAALAAGRRGLPTAVPDEERGQKRRPEPSVELNLGKFIAVRETRWLWNKNSKRRSTNLAY